MRIGDVKQRIVKVSKVTTFINLSGGVDSTYYLWRWLNENKNNDEMILVHHCLFLTRRKKEEKTACEKILKYLKNQGLVNFMYVETGLQKGNLKATTLDIELLSGLSNVIVKSYPSIKNILWSYCKEETSDLDNHYISGGNLENYKNSHRYWKVVKTMEIMTGRVFSNIIYPDKKTKGIFSKKQMIEEMPKELFEMTWYCRTPINGKVCGECHTCKKVNKILSLSKI